MHSRGNPGLGLRLFVRSANAAFPGLGVRDLRAKLRFVVACLKVQDALNDFFARTENRLLLRDLDARPQLMGFVVWPYIHSGWSVLQRFEALSQHWQAMNTDMAAVAISPTESLLVTDMSEASAGLRLVIDRAPWCLREGSLVFNQFLNEERLMSLSFSFGIQDGERVAYVGGIQGSNVDSALEKYREISKGLERMRTRDFLIKAFQFLTFHLGVKRVLCVSEEQRHHRHPFFARSKSEKLHLNYDEIWQEHGGMPDGDGFYRLGSLPIIRPMEDIATKSRPLYRRRYALMDKLSADISSRFGSASASTQTEPPNP